MTVIVRSCLTGKAVWIYQGPSKAACRKAYWRACKREMERVARWNETVDERRASLQRLLAELTARLPPMGELPPEKKAAAKVIASMAAERPKCDTAFYDHIVETRRRREEDRLIRQRMREHDAMRDAYKNPDYVKQGK